MQPSQVLVATFFVGTGALACLLLALAGGTRAVFGILLNPLGHGEVRLVQIVALQTGSESRGRRLSAHLQIGRLGVGRSPVAE